MITEETLMDYIREYCESNIDLDSYVRITRMIEKWFEEQVQELDREVTELLKILVKCEGSVTESSSKIIERDLLKRSTKAKLDENLPVQAWLKRKIPVEVE